jgi:excisionase family DNA binding protein
MKLTAVLPGYGSVAHAAQVLHLAPRSVRDLIYSGRLPSLRIGRLHLIRATDLEAERRRRMGLPLPRPRTRRAETPTQRQHTYVPVDPAVRAQRAAERTAARLAWAQQHRQSALGVPFQPLQLAEATRCGSCGRELGAGAHAVDQLATQAQPEHRLCVRCGRRAILAWADQRQAQTVAARRMAADLGARDGGDQLGRVAA